MDLTISISLSENSSYNGDEEQHSERLFMMEKRGVLWIGGDRRQIFGANAMHAKGWKISVCENEGIDGANGKRFDDWQVAIAQNDVLVFPLPMTKKDMTLNSPNRTMFSEVLEYIRPNAVVLGGKPSFETLELLSKNGIQFFDYYNEELQMRNALPTAEAAIGLVLLESPRVLSGRKALVVGYGKVGKILAQKLQVLGVSVVVGARKPTDLALASSFGHETFSISNGIPSRFLEGVDFIFNTVPVRLFSEVAKKCIKSDTIYVELASSPYGLDLESVGQYEFRVILAESLPGKYSPITAGEILAESVVQILEKEGISP